MEEEVCFEIPEVSCDNKIRQVEETVYKEVCQVEYDEECTTQVLCNKHTEKKCTNSGTEASCEVSFKLSNFQVKHALK